MPEKEVYQNAPVYYQQYFDLVSEHNLIDALKADLIQTVDFLKELPRDRQNFAYDADKWTINEVIQHIIDTERIFQYRAFRFSRFDSAPLSGFDENHYIDSVNDLSLELDFVVEDFISVRKSSIHLFEPMTEKMLHFRGTANKLGMNAEQLGFMIVGHTIHHLNVIKERYF
jgi:hypothetical protein